MTPAPQTPLKPACFGVLCHKHAQCARWHLVERQDDRDTMLWCGPGLPRYEPIEKVEA